MPDLERMKQRVAMAAGREPADILIRNAKVVDVFSGTIRETPVSIGDGVFLGFKETQAKKSIDAQGRYLLPGLIDAHIHIESSMATPSRFAELVLPHGTTTVIADPHEIANVHGMDGIRAMIENSQHLPLHCFFALPSCVPATPFEDAGATLTAEDLEAVIDDPHVISIGEMMNFPGVVAGDSEVLEKIALGLRYGKVTDGHAPGVLGQDLDAYLVSGISNTHECSTLAEMDENLQRGSYILIREGSAAKNLAALLPGVTSANARRCAFCCDDRHPADIVRDGHMDNHLRLAVKLGMDPILAITLCTLNAAECFRLHSKGAIAPGRDADCLLVDDLKDFKVRQVISRGRSVVDEGRLLVSLEHSFLSHPSMHLPSLSESLFALHIPSTRARVIGIEPHSLVSRHLVRDVHTDSNGLFHCSANPGLSKIAVIERHTASGKIGLGLLEGYGITNGAIATTIAHDSHNVVVAGDSSHDMLLAVRELEAIGGGIVVVHNSMVTGRLPLPIAGLMSHADPLELSSTLDVMLRHAHQDLHIPRTIEPFMTLSFMALPVIPHLKITDRGLFDCDSFVFVPIAV